jgi:hypothetical protein
MPRQAFDVDTLLHVHQKSVHAAQETYCLRLTTIMASLITVISLLFSFCSYFRILFLRCWHDKADPSLVTAPRVTPVPDAVLEHVETGTQSQDPQERSSSPRTLYRTLNAEPWHEDSTSWSPAR